MTFPELFVQGKVDSQVESANKLRTFTNKLRHAILHNADIASMWSPAAHVADVKATLDSKLNDSQIANSVTQVIGHWANPRQY